MKLYIRNPRPVLSPLCYCTMLLHPEPGAYWYTPEMMKDREVIALAKRVKPGTLPRIRQ